MIKSLINIFSSPYFEFFFITGLTSFLVILIKKISAKDEDIKPQFQDFAVGFELYVVALILFVNKCYQWKMNDALDISTQEKNNFSVWIAFFSFVFLMILCYIVRILGWEKKFHGNSLHWFWGVLLPDIIGILYLFIVTEWIGV